jgi:hypothetical protein
LIEDPEMKLSWIQDHPWYPYKKKRGQRELQKEGGDVKMEATSGGTTAAIRNWN